MDRLRRATLRALLIFTLVLPLMPAGAAPGDKVLLFTLATGYRHDSIKDPDGTGPLLPPTVQAIKDLGASEGLVVDWTESPTAFTDTNLAQYKAVIFAQTSGDKIFSDAQKASFERYISNGGGFAGVHSAAYSSLEWAWFHELIGAKFYQHPPAVVTATVRVADRSHPSVSGVPQSWQRTDEWYDFQTNPRGKVHVLATLDEKTYSGGTMGVDHPISWCRRFGRARSWYTGMGHTVASYSEASFLSHLRGGILWAAGLAPGDCGATIDLNYDRVVLDDDINQPMSLAVLPDKRVLFLERAGKVKLYTPGSGTTLAATIPTEFVYDLGLQGVAADPGFTANGWVYLFYTERGGVRNRLSRFQMVGDVLDPASEMVVITYPIIRHCCHQGGSIAFDASGNLLLTTGDDSTAFESDGYAPIDERAGRADNDAQKSSANTQDLRGKILRIRPLASSGSGCSAGQIGIGCTYSIPPGNLFPADGSAGSPEIYAMGFRNPFRLSVDPETGWIYVGDVGPDAWNDDNTRGPKGYDEINQIRGPGNMGWPYCIADNKPYRDFDFLARLPKLPFDCAAPVNDSPNNTGSSALPPAQPAWLWYPYAKSVEFPEVTEGYRTAQAGPVYHYDPSNPNENKLPAYFDDTLFVYDWVRGVAWEIKLDAAGRIFKINPFLKGLKAPIDMELGPDGSLYILQWGESLSYEGVGTPTADLIRVEYVDGRHHPVVRVDNTTGTEGPAPRTVSFSSVGSYDVDPGDSLTYNWDFGDGTTSAEPNPTHTYAAGNFTARLVVTDTTGRSASTTVQVVSGNNVPDITVHAPVDGMPHEFGDTISYRVSVDDIEDGSTTDGGIDCSLVQAEVAFAHDTHSHPLNTVQGCEGTIVTQPSGSHNGDDRLATTISFSYRDRGTGVANPVTGRKTIRLLPSRVQAEHYTQQSGTKVLAAADRSGRTAVGNTEHGDWISFKPMSFEGVKALGFRVSAAELGGRIEIRIDSPFGPKIGEVQVPSTGSWTNWVSVLGAVQDPGGSHEVFLVFTRPLPVATCVNGYTCNEDLDTKRPLIYLNWVDFLFGRSTDSPKLIT